MANAQPLHATFFAFHKREKGGVLLGASVAYVIAALVIGGVFFAINAATIGPFIGWYAQVMQGIAGGNTAAASQIPPPEGVGTLMLSIIPFMFFIYLLLAAFEAGCLRWMIRGETGGFMGLTLGADTWRVYSSYWIWFLLYMGYSIVAGIIMAVIIGVGAVALRDSLGVIPITITAYCLNYAVLAVLAVRFAPASATSVGRKKFSFFSAWTVTRGRFWSLLGSFLLIYIGLIVLELIVGAVVFGVVLRGQMEGMASGKPDPSAMANMMSAMFQPQNLAVLIGSYLVILVAAQVLFVMGFGVNARAVIAAAEDGKVDGVASAGVANTFS